MEKVQLHLYYSSIIKLLLLSLSTTAPSKGALPLSAGDKFPIDNDFEKSVCPTSSILFTWRRRRARRLRTSGNIEYLLHSIQVQRSWSIRPLVSVRVPPLTALAHRPRILTDALL